FGILVTGSGSTDTVIQGNYIGTTADGLSALGNVSFGVSTGNDTHDNTIGGSTAAARNIIAATQLHSGSDAAAGSGVLLDGSNNVLHGNYIGTNKNADVALPNIDSGVWVRGVGNTVGGSNPGEGNLIVGAAPPPGQGSSATVSVWQATNALIQGNLIGTNAAGTAALGDAPNGAIRVFASSGTTIGGSSSWSGGRLSGAGNVINGDKGIATDGATVIQGNAIGTDI